MAGRPRALAVVRDGRRVVISADDQHQVWDLAERRKVAVFSAFRRQLCGVVDDTKGIFSDGDTIEIVNLETGATSVVLRGHQAEVRACVYVPGRSALVSIADDETLRIWDLGDGSCRFVHRGEAGGCAVGASEEGIMVGNWLGGISFLDWPT